MRGWRRAMAALAGVGAVLVATAGCAPKVASTGQKLADASQPLDTALTRLKKDNNAGIQNNSITVSSETDCFYSKAGKDAKGISDQAVCGPIRRLGLGDDRIWDRYQLTFKSDSDGNAVATVGKATAQGVAVDTSLLISPDGDKPATASDLPAPKAPQTSVSNRAVAVAENATPAGLSFTPPSHPVKLITPAATITVTGSAPVKTVPDALVAGQNDPAGKAAYYLPASGQKLYAYQVRISAPREAAVPASTGGSTRPKDPATALELRSGSTAIPINDQTGASGASSTLTVPCAKTGSAAYPCKPRTTVVTLLMTVPAAGALSLSATSAGARQSVDLGTGAVTSAVSTVEYDRAELTDKVDKRLKTDPYQVRVQQPASEPSSQPTSEISPSPGSKDTAKPEPAGQPKAITAEARWSVTVDSVAMTAYDPNLGWAPKDQAWMIVSTSNYRRTEKGATFTDHRAGSLAVSIDNVGHPVKGPTDAGIAAHPDDDVSWAFAVPADASAATISFRPTGTVSAGGASTSFTSDQPATVQVDLPH